jgi:hypothetical protein
VPQHHVLADRQVRAEVHLLVDRRYPGGLRVCGGGEDAVLAAQSAYVDSGAFPELLNIYNLLGDPALRIE